MSTMTQTAVTIVRAFFEALEQHDLGTVVPLLADDVVESVPLSNTGSSEPWAFFDGKPAVVEYLGSIVKNFSRVVMADKEFSVTNDGETVFVETKGDLIWAATGAEYHNVYVFKFDIRFGKIHGIKEYANPITFAKLAGLPIG